MSASSRDNSPTGSYWRELDALWSNAGARTVAGERSRVVWDPGESDAAAYDDPADHLHELVVLVAFRARDVLLARQGQPKPSDQRVAVKLEADASLASLRAPTGHTDSPSTRTWATNVRDRTKASLAARVRLPFVEVCQQFGLNSFEAQVLSTVCAAAVRPEIARLFRAISDDPSRPLVDEHLLRQMLPRPDHSSDPLLRALRADATLRREGLLRVSDDGPFSSIDVDPVLLARLRGIPSPGLRSGVTMRIAIATIDSMYLHPKTRADVQALVTRLAAPVWHEPIVLRGGRGTGRRTLAAALAALQRRGLTEIDVTKLEDGCTVRSLREELRRAALRGSWPCVVGLEQAMRTVSEAARRELFTAVQEAAGRIFVLALPEDRLAFDDLWMVVDVLPLSGATHRLLWADVVTDPQRAVDPVPPIAPGPLRLAAAETLNQGPIVQSVVEAVRRRALAMLPAGLGRFEPIPWTGVAGAATRTPALREGHRAVLLIGAPGSGREHVARAIVGPPGTVRVDLADFVAGDQALAYARVDQLIAALEMGVFGAVLVGIDDAVRTGSPGVVSCLARALSRVPGPIVATSSGGAVDPFRPVFDLRHLLVQAPTDRADVWRHHLGSRALELADQIAALSQRPTALAVIAEAARLFQLGRADELADAVELAHVGLC